MSRWRGGCSRRRKIWWGSIGRMWRRMKRCVKYALLGCMRVGRRFWISVGMGFMRIAWSSRSRCRSWTTTSPSNAPTKPARQTVSSMISNPSFPPTSSKSINSTHWKLTLICMAIQSHGVPLRIVDICSFIRREMMLGFSVWSVGRNIVWIADVIGIRIWLVRSIRWRRRWRRMIRSFLILWRGRSSSSVQSASFGWRRISAATIWPANANSNSATSVVESIWNANA